MAAVRPQEGWYVRDTMTYSYMGTEREYFIIDNKMSAQPWYISTWIGSTVLNDSLFSTPDWGNKGLDSFWRVVGYASTYYRGYSDVDWVVDDDWLCIIDWQGFSSSSTVPSFSFFVFDKSKLPVLTYDNRLDAYSITGVYDAFLGHSVTSQVSYSVFGLADSQSGSSGHYVFRLGGGVLTVTGQNRLYNPFLYAFNSDYSFYDVDGTSINDLCVVPLPNGTRPEVGFLGGTTLQYSVCWAVPVDKCPAGTQVGDSWPKVRPLDVQMEDAYSAWMDSALANTPVSDSSQVGQQIKDYNDQLDASDNWGELATAGWAFIQPMFDSFDFIFVILGIAAVSFILLLLIKKGMG